LVKTLKGKFEFVPTKEQLHILVTYFKKHADKNGVVNATQRQMLEDPSVRSIANSPAYLTGFTTYFQNEGWITRLQTDSHHKTAWDVNNILKNPEKVLTKEVVGLLKPRRDENNELIVKAKVEVVKESEATQVEADSIEEVSSEQINVMESLRSAVTDMQAYLQQLPEEMGGHLTKLSNKLDSTNPAIIKNLRQANVELLDEKNNLEKEVKSLKAELEEASGKENYSRDAIYRQRNFILDEVDRALNLPAWNIKHNKNNIRNTIEKHLDNIMRELQIIQ